MTDHSKPVGWWCPVCGDFDNVWHAVGCMVLGDKHNPVLRYLPLPTPEPTTWGESGGDEAVCFYGHHYVVGSKAGDNGAPFAVTGQIDDGEPFFYVLGKDVDLPTAIRHVAEE